MPHTLFQEQSPPQNPRDTSYEILPIGVRERHHDIKARMFRGCLVGVDLQRHKERTDEELICFVIEDLESDGNNYFLVSGQVGGVARVDTSTYESPLRCGRLGEPEVGRRAESEARARLGEAGEALQKRVVGRLKRKGGERVSDRRHAVLIRT